MLFPLPRPHVGAVVFCMIGIAQQGPQNVLCFNSLMMRRIMWSQIATTSKNFVSRIKIHMLLTNFYGRRSGFTQTREIDYYNLEMITSIGYRVKSRQGVLFRQWANKVLSSL